MFGWKTAPYVHHTTNLKAMSCLREPSITGFFYIDDKILEEFNGPVPNDLDNPLSQSYIE